MGAPGSVAHGFDHLAILRFAGEDADAILEILLAGEVDVTDVECEDGKLTIFAPANEFHKAKQAVLEAYPETEFDVDEISYVPQTNVDISEDDLPMFEKLISMLNECEDVQDVYHNGIVP
jgi:transcriptional/translational regulatory protein YebC/TACO1